MLRRHGIEGELSQVIVTPPPPALEAAAVGPCPPGTHRKLVCEFRDGVFVCEERCVPNHPIL